ncbi:MAG TPA: LacI family DNA-binding transcriptional regulator [Anaeromyxobacter sp.]|nr:LacI family DNA-binding transcriptional regulator [Anaeromyxobacter sp.]
MRRGQRPAGGPATLVQVAQAARVSPSTVSRILNGTARVTEKKRRAVEAVIARLGFHPNPMARGLRQGRRMTIGIVALSVESPFFGAIFRGIADALAGSEFAPLILSGSPDPAEEAQRIALLLSRRVDGVIAVTCRVPDEQLIRLAGTAPIVVCGRALCHGKVFGIKLDNVLAGLLAVRHLIGLGHRRILHLEGPPDHLDAAERLEGYRRALDEARVPFDPALVVRAGFYSEDGLGAVGRVLDTRRRFSAIFAANDECAYGARLGLFQRGLRVPEDVSLVGVDDLPVSRYTTPPLTTVRQPLEDVGRRAVGSLLDLLHGRDPSTAGIPQVELVIRGTTAPQGQAAFPHAR